MKITFLILVMLVVSSCSSSGYRLCDVEHYERAWSSADLNRCI